MAVIDDSHYLTVDEVATKLGCTARTVRSWISRGELRSAKAGRLVRIEPDDLRAYLSAGVRSAGWTGS